MLDRVSTPVKKLELLALSEIPEVVPGDNIAQLLLQSLITSNLILQHGDVLVIAQKIISKAENRYASLKQVSPTPEAIKLAEEVDKDPRLVNLILDESAQVLRKRRGVLIVEHKLGYIHANAGIDRSNIVSDDDDPRVLLLPEAPDKSAAKLREQLHRATGKNVNIIINDSAGRAWRNGSMGFAIGTAGFEPVQNLIGQHDMFGNQLHVTEVAVADELAAAASFMMGQADQALPAVLVRGAKLAPSEDGSSSLIRAKEQDLFR